MDKYQMREVIAKRAAKELHDGDVVNLGIGIPTLIPNYLPEGISVTLQTENGAMGMGPTPEEGKEDKNLINAGGGAITLNPGACTFDSATSFAIIRGGHVNVSFLVPCRSMRRVTWPTGSSLARWLPVWAVPWISLWVPSA